MSAGASTASCSQDEQNQAIKLVRNVAASATAAELEAVAKASEKVKPFLEGKTIRKVIVLPKRLVNIVVG